MLLVVDLAMLCASSVGSVVPRFCIFRPQMLNMHWTWKPSCWHALSESNKLTLNSWQSVDRNEA